MLRSTVIKVKPLEGYKLDLTFDNGERKVFSLEPYIKGEWYSELRDTTYFNQVRANGFSVEWPDGQDLCPNEIYY